MKNVHTVQYDNMCLILDIFGKHTVNAISFLCQAYVNWQENPTLNSLLTTGLPIADIDFPAITICGEGSIYEVVANGFDHICSCF